MGLEFFAAGFVAGIIITCFFFWVVRFMSDDGGESRHHEFQYKADEWQNRG